jgi:glycine betaine/proline transport system ATP-binding protein
LISGYDRDFLYVLDAQRRFIGVVSSASLQEAMESCEPDSPLNKAFLKKAKPVKMTDSMQDILPLVASSPFPVPVVDDDNFYKGVVSKNRFLKTLHKTETKAS